jgi:hypothetical protein
MSKALTFSLLGCLIFSAFDYGSQRDTKTEYRLWLVVDSSGGAGLAGKNGQLGMNGCPGGTTPSPDGRYYLPGTHEECNPAHKKPHHQDGYPSGEPDTERA